MKKRLLKKLNCGCRIWRIVFREPDGYIWHLEPCVKEHQHKLDSICVREDLKRLES